jgi:hypothetical protein
MGVVVPTIMVKDRHDRAALDSHNALDSLIKRFPPKAKQYVTDGF